MDTLKDLTQQHLSLLHRIHENILTHKDSIKSQCYSIEKDLLHNDLDCYYEEFGNKIDVYSSVYWSADSEEDYKRKEDLINSYSYEDDLIKVNAWCDISGYEYWVIDQQDNNYVSIDVCLKKPVEDYTQQEIFAISEMIGFIDDYFKVALDSYTHP